ncbi:4811_t:CDS:2 [Paraglomus occultum]|uniref:4811_t:CDS:1 n=1 Tax=Paraglomus occultum TaxID=144539 RepID=A0A9N9AIC5_9GLOM|nr:4811_t:CDS:2 [Paraglomus occultum]
MLLHSHLRVEELVVTTTVVAAPFPIEGDAVDDDVDNDVDDNVVVDISVDVTYPHTKFANIRTYHDKDGKVIVYVGMFGLRNPLRSAKEKTSASTPLMQAEGTVETVDPLLEVLLELVSVGAVDVDVDVTEAERLILTLT